MFKPQVYVNLLPQKYEMNTGMKEKFELEIASGWGSWVVQSIECPTLGFR